MAGTSSDRWRESNEYNDDRSYDDLDESLSIQVGAIPVKGLGARTPWVEDDSFPTNDHDTETVTYTTEPTVSCVANVEGLATAILVSEDDHTMMDQLDPTLPYYAAEEIHEEEVQKGFDGFLRRNALKICLCVVVLVIGSILGTIFGIRASKEEKELDAEAMVLKAGSQRFRDAAKRLLLQNVTEREVLLNASLTTPQYSALKWLADDDEAVIDLSNEVTLIQRYSLAVLYFSSGGGDSWTDTLNFTSGLNECEWYSVKAGIRHGVAECSEDGVLTELRLNENNLKGTIPEEFGQFVMLKSADFSNNSRLSGSIPTTIGLLTNLESFAVTESGMSGTIPIEIGELTLLKTLSLGGNMLAGLLPDTVGLLSLLEHLLLNNNALGGTIPTTVSRLKNLIEVDFSFNGFEDGADNICAMNSTILSTYAADCFMDDIPSIPLEIACSCCTSCCSEKKGGCEASQIGG